MLQCVHKKSTFTPNLICNGLLLDDEKLRRINVYLCYATLCALDIIVSFIVMHSLSICATRAIIYEHHTRTTKHIHTRSHAHTHERTNTRIHEHMHTSCFMHIWRKWQWHDRTRTVYLYDVLDRDVYTVLYQTVRPDLPANIVKSRRWGYSCGSYDTN